MTTSSENIHRELQRLSRPLVMAGLANTVNAFAGTLFLARHSDAALRASLPAATLASTFSAVFITVIGYSGLVVARYHGQGRERLAVHTFVQGLWLWMFSLPFFAGALTLTKEILSFFDYTTDVFTAAVAYCRLLLAAGLFQSLAAVFAGFFTGRGQTRLPSSIQTFACLVDMVLTPVLVFGVGPHASAAIPAAHALVPAMGIVGAGWAALIAAALPICGLGWKAFRDPLLPRPIEQTGNSEARTTWHGVYRFLPNLTRAIFGQSVPNGLRMLIDTGGFFVLTAFLAELDPLSSTTSTMAFAVLGIYYAMLRGTTGGAEILAARHIQEGSSLLRQLILAAIRQTFTRLGLFLVVLMAASGLVVDAFHTTDSPFSAMALRTAFWTLLPILVIREILENLQQTLMAVLNGLGDTWGLLRIQALVSLVCWLPLVFLVRSYHPTLAAYWATMLVYLIAAALLLARLFVESSRRIGRPK